MNRTLQIRNARPEDAPVLIEFNRAMALETEGRELNPEKISAGVRAVFSRPDLGFYIVAELADDEDGNAQTVGTLLITFEWSDWRNGLFWWIQSVYVRPEYRRRSIFRKMYSHIRRRAASEETVCGLRLYVEKENRVARETYRSLGMTETPYRLFETEALDDTASP